MKKKLLISAIALCLAAILACGTLAYFTAKHEVTNTFKAAEYDPQNPQKPDELFGIEVNEADPTDPSNPTKRSNGDHQYKDMVPGGSFTKDPTVKNTGAYDEYVRVIVTFDKVSEWAQIPDAVGSKTNITYDKLFATLISGFDSTNWIKVDPVPADVKDNKVAYTFYYKNKLAPGASATLFTTVSIPASVTTDSMTTIDGFTVKVLAQAIQAANTGADAQTAFTNCWGK